MRLFRSAMVAAFALAACNPAGDDSGTTGTGTGATDTVGAGDSTSRAGAIAPQDEAAPGDERFNLTGQVYDVETEVAGFYLPVDDDLVIDGVHLYAIFVGMEWEFDAWQEGSEDSPAPVMVEFEDRSSPSGTNELGQTWYEVTYRFIPENLLVTDTTLAFNGTHERFGEIRFYGEFDAEQVAAMQAGDPVNSRSALIGTLHIGDETFERVVFQGWLGD